MSPHRRTFPHISHSKCSSNSEALHSIGAKSFEFSFAVIQKFSLTSNSSCMHNDINYFIYVMKKTWRDHQLNKKIKLY